VKVAVLRIGHRLVRDDRTTTHVALVARAFGSQKLYMTEVDDSIMRTLDLVCKRWGAPEFEIEIIDQWKNLIRDWKKDHGKVVHLTMYGVNIDNAIHDLRKETKLLVVVGAEKVPREVYDLADYNIAIGNQPHSEIAALAILLDRIFKGKQFRKHFASAALRIIPTAKGKKVEEISKL
jgi:tRNA (cytidine56-2'-O)-methyltransferase